MVVRMKEPYHCAGSLLPRLWSTGPTRREFRYVAAMRILVLGAGFGGLELTTRLADEFGTGVDLTLIDQADGFVFGFSKLDVMFGRTTEAAVHHHYRDVVKPGVRFVQS